MRLEIPYKKIYELQNKFDLKFKFLISKIELVLKLT
jgi:hypothetical protein